MSKSIQSPAPAFRTWSTPRLKRLGTITDVEASINTNIAQSPDRS